LTFGLVVVQPPGDALPLALDVVGGDPGVAGQPELQPAVDAILER
jgi:hypothetical protein